MSEQGELKKEMTLKDAFWFASGVPALVLFSIGAIVATVGNLSWVVWTISVCVKLFSRSKFNFNSQKEEVIYH